MPGSGSAGGMPGDRVPQGVTCVGVPRGSLQRDLKTGMCYAAAMEETQVTRGFRAMGYDSDMVSGIWGI